MYLRETIEKTQFTRNLSTGDQVPYFRNKTWYHFSCDNCKKEFKRPKNGKDTLAREVHYCSDCPIYSLAAKRTIEGRRKKSEIRGRKFDRGYPEVYVGENYPYRNSKWVREHIYVIEQHIGQRIPEGMVVHHIDGSKDNNHLDNLLLCSVEQHNQCHAKIERLVFELYAKGLVEFDRDKLEYYYKG